MGIENAIVVALGLFVAMVLSRVYVRRARHPSSMSLEAASAMFLMAIVLGGLITFALLWQGAVALGLAAAGPAPLPLVAALGLAAVASGFLFARWLIKRPPRRRRS